jgi:hypothetical protein
LLSHIQFEVSVIVGKGGIALVYGLYQRAANGLAGNAVHHRAADGASGMSIRSLDLALGEPRREHGDH